MHKSQIIKSALINSLSAAVYVIIVGSFLYYGPSRFGPINSVIVPIALLLLLVLSAALLGLIIFAKPVMMYLNDSKKEALQLVSYTVAFLAAVTVIALVVLFLVAQYR